MLQYGAKSRYFVSKTLFLPVRTKTRFVNPSGALAYEDDYAEAAEYPKINMDIREFSEKKRQRRQENLQWQASIKNKRTVEEKLMEFNVNRRYGWKCCLLNEDNLDYNSLPFHQYITRTHLVPNSMPHIYTSQELTEKVRHFSEKLRADIEDVVKFELFGFKKPVTENETESERAMKSGESIVNQISRTILQGLSAEEKSLQTLQVDYRPKSEAFWIVEGFDQTVKERRVKSSKESEPTKVRNFQFIGSPLTQIRSKVPLLKFTNQIDEEFYSKELDVDRFLHIPAEFGVFETLRYATNIPGHWTGDEAKQNLISFHSSHFLEPTVPYNQPSSFNKLAQPSWVNQRPALRHSHAMLVSFSKLLAQAYAHGFDQFTDVDYPMTSQTVVTNGRDWSFYAYQLNTIRLEDKAGAAEGKKPKQNICWGLPALQILDESGKLNTEVLDWLLKFYLTTTVSPAVQAPMPHVKENLDRITDNIRREYILFNFQDMYSQKRTEIESYQMPEIYNWERIFKINHQQRPMDARKREFEQPGVKPYTQKYVFKDPQKRSKRLKFLQAELAEKKEKERIERVREAQSARFKTSDS